MQPSFLDGDDLAVGTRAELMPQYHAMLLDVCAVYPTRKHVSPKVRALIDFLSMHFAKKRGGNGRRTPWTKAQAPVGSLAAPSTMITTNPRQGRFRS